MPDEGLSVSDLKFVKFNLDNASDELQLDVAFDSKLEEIDMERTFLLTEDHHDLSVYEELPKESYERVETSMYAPVEANAAKVKGKICCAMRILYSEEEQMKPQIETASGQRDGTITRA
eukprot:Seg5125.2 transcript_id=Seg5125.2/GoldUCD/mRNA.D3Y31 product="hypothetical protein" protein_id=Seg5125.2/GoldUCD/D3Y31